jgi:hypothetical protein
LAQIGAHGGDPRISVELQETFACLPIKRQRLLLNFVASGQIAESARQAGYNCTTARSASEVGRQVLADPRVQFCLRAIQSAEHGNGAALATILAHHMAGFQGSEADRNRSAKIALSVYWQTRPVPVPGTKPLADQLLDEMSVRELETFITEKRWPERFRDRLAPSMCAAMDVRHHHARQPPAQSSEDPVNTHAARHRAPRESREPLDTEDTAPPRSAPPSVGASSRSTDVWVVGDFIEATAPVFGDDRVYDPQAAASPTPTAAINAPLLESHATAQREIALGEARLREEREPVPPDLQRLALRDRKW